MKMSALRVPLARRESAVDCATNRAAARGSASRAAARPTPIAGRASSGELVRRRQQAWQSVGKRRTGRERQRDTHAPEMPRQSRGARQTARQHHDQIATSGDCEDEGENIDRNQDRPMKSRDAWDEGRQVQRQLQAEQGERSAKQQACSEADLFRKTDAAGGPANRYPARRNEVGDEGPDKDIHERTGPYESEIDGKDRHHEHRYDEDVAGLSVELSALLRNGGHNPREQADHPAGDVKEKGDRGEDFKHTGPRSAVRACAADVPAAGTLIPYCRFNTACHI